MNPLLALSLAVDGIALIWSLVLVRRLADKRLLLLVPLVLLLAFEQLSSAVRGGEGTPAIAAGGVQLLLSLLLLANVALAGRLLAERQRVRRELEIEKAHLGRLFESSPEAVVLLDNQDRVLRINGAFGRLFGYRIEEAAGRPINELIAPPALAAEATALTEKVKRGESVSVETHRRKKDGSLVEVSILGAPIMSGDGQVAIYGIYRDISERKMREQALIDSEQRFRAVFEAGPTGAVLTDRAGRFLEVNHAFRQLIGYSEEELGRMTVTDITDEEDLPETRRLIKRLWEGEIDRVALEKRYRHKDGRTVWCQTTASPIRDGDGRLLYVVAMLENITERRRAEAALRESEERFSKVFHASPEAMMIHEIATGRFLEVNKSFTDMMGYARDEIIGRTVRDLALTQEVQHRDQMMERLGREGEIRNFEMEVITRGRERRVVLMSAVRIELQGKACALSIGMDITERKRAEAALKESEERYALAALHDALTGLPNRTFFTEILERALERRKLHPDHGFAVLFLDLDRFKLINDSLGHVLGDRVLTTIARRLEASLRSRDVVARMGGDEFTILLDEVREVEEAIPVAERIRQRLTAPISVEGREVYLSASLGLALSDAGETPEDILRGADIAMYRAKVTDSQLQVFDRSMYSETVALLELETDLRRAIKRHELSLRYQPIVSLADGRLVGFEALLRWFHPRRGWVRPGQFIPRAEETGLIVEIGDWVLQETCRQLKEWKGRLPEREEPPLVISVNLSARQFHQPDLVDRVLRLVEESGLSPSNLILEITESALMEEAEQHVGLVRKLHDHGFRVHIDDFGTGYSSLSYLHRFSIDALKIDRGFVHRLMSGDESTEIVQSIVTLAGNLGLSLIAEGVETDEQRQALTRLSCHLGQGYLFAPPLAPDEAEALLWEGTVAVEAPEPLAAGGGPESRPSPGPSRTT